MAPGPDGDEEIDRQRAEVETAFRERRRGVLTERDYAEARAILDHGGWTGLGRETVEAVRNGVRPGDPLPPVPCIADVTGVEAVIIGDGPERQVAVLFSSTGFPGVRFGHRFEPGPGSNAIALIELQEEIETGALDRMMLDPPAADESGIIWTAWDAYDE